MGINLVSKGGVSKRLLNQHGGNFYVYYANLAEHAPELYSNVAGRLEGIATSVNYDNIYNTLINQAQAEATREVALLNKYFGFNIQIPKKITPDVMRDIVQAINQALTTKHVLERNLSRIKHKNTAKIDVSKFFPQYFQKALNNYSDELISSIYRLIMNNTDAKTAYQTVLSQKMSEIVGEALHDTLSSAALGYKSTQKQDEELSDAYAEIIEQLKNLDRSNQLIQDICRNYNVDKIIEKNAQEFAESFKNSSKEAFNNIDLSKMINPKVSGYGGTDMESIRAALMNIVVSGLSSPEIQVIGGSAQTGGLGIKADVITSIGFDLSEVTTLLNDKINGNPTSRLQNIEAMEDLYNSLKNVKEGFIIYESDKNYTLNYEFKARGGFSAGAPTSIANLKDILGKIPSIRNINSMIGSLLQFGEGAIGADHPEALSSLLDQLSQAMAYFLFDDFKTLVGKQVATGATALHIFNLSGFIIPLSYLLYCSAEALHRAEHNTKDIFQFTLNSPAVLYADQPEEWTEEGWGKQAQYAIANTTLEMHFLSSFKDIILSIF